LASWTGVLISLGVGAAVFAMSYRFNHWLLDRLRFHSIGTRDYIVDRLKLMFIEVDPHHVLIALFAFSFGLGALVFLVMLPNAGMGVFFALLVTAIGWKAPKPIVDAMYERRTDLFVAQMVDGLGLMANGMKSGLSVVQALGLVAAEMPNPIRQEFELVLSENKLGVSLEEAFTNLSKRVRSDEVEMFVTSVNILKETGGNLAETFETIVNTIRERVKAENKIKTITRAGYLQGMTVLCVPPGLGALFYFNDPAFMAPLFTSFWGWVIVLTVLLLEVAALFVIRKVVRIEV